MSPETRETINYIKRFAQEHGGVHPKELVVSHGVYERIVADLVLKPPVVNLTLRGVKIVGAYVYPWGKFPENPSC